VGDLDERTRLAALARGHGVIDLSRASPELEAVISEAAIPRSELERIAGPDRQIKGAREFDQLEGLVDRLEAGQRSRFITSFEHEVERNRGSWLYSEPGSSRAEPQARLTVDRDALRVPADERKPARDLHLPGIDQFDLYPDDERKAALACFEAASRHVPALAGPDRSIQIAIREDARGRIEVDPEQARIAREYIDRMLDRGRPVVGGVSFEAGRFNRDRITDHFVTIFRRGYDRDGRLFYDFRDPGNGGRPGRFHVDRERGILFREGSGRSRFVADADYELSQVRTYR
jgi:hypothetical protein